MKSPSATNLLPQRIYNAIEELSTRGDKWNTIMRGRNPRPGEKAKCYKLLTDNVPDWPRASFLLWELNEFDKRRSRQSFAHICLRAVGIGIRTISMKSFGASAQWITCIAHRRCP